MQHGVNAHVTAFQQNTAFCLWGAQSIEDYSVTAGAKMN